MVNNIQFAEKRNP